MPSNHRRLTILLSRLINFSLVLSIIISHWIHSIWAIEIRFGFRMFWNIFPASWTPPIWYQLNLTVQFIWTSYSCDRRSFLPYIKWCLRVQITFVIFLYQLIRKLVVKIFNRRSIFGILRLIPWTSIGFVSSINSTETFWFVSPICINKRRLFTQLV